MNTVDILVGNRIRACRRAIGMSQAKLGQKVGVKFQQIQKYETGLNRVSASRLWAIADALDVPVVHFFLGIEASSDTRNAIAIDHYACLSDPQILELIERFYVLKTDHKQAILDLVRSMKKPDETNQTRASISS